MIVFACRNPQILSCMKLNWGFLKSPMHCLCSSALPLIPGRTGDTALHNFAPQLLRWCDECPCLQPHLRVRLRSERPVVEETVSMFVPIDKAQSFLFFLLLVCALHTGFCRRTDLGRCSVSRLL